MTTFIGEREHGVLRVMGGVATVRAQRRQFTYWEGVLFVRQLENINIFRF